ncbi:MAG TPA: Ig-like domain repeat protein [Terriglobia bacterium]|nr:Ig-like domain repeat protein [Terriglobia bacterium]
MSHRKTVCLRAGERRPVLRAAGQAAKFSAVILLASFAIVRAIWAGQAGSEPTVSQQTPHQVLDGTAQKTGHYNPNQMLRLALALKPPHLDEERQLIQQMYDKKSPQFHKFLTAKEWNNRFAPSAQDEQAVADWAGNQGLKITRRYSNHLLVDVEAPAGTIEKALNIEINNYQIGTTSFFSNDRDPLLPPYLASVIWSVQGLNSLEHEHPVSKRGQKIAPAADYVAGPAVAAGPVSHADGDPSQIPAGVRKGKKAAEQKGNPLITGGGYDPTDIYSSEAYDFNALYAQGHCCNPLANPGQSPAESSIAIATFDSVNLSDIAGFQAQYPYLAYYVQLYDIDGSPSFSDAEGTMDTEWSTAMSNSFGSYQDTAKVYVYQGANYLNNTITDVYNAMLNDGYARVFSTSWYCTELTTIGTNEDCLGGTMNARDAIFLSMVGQGWTLVAASGDAGATSGCGDADAVQFPSTDPNVIAAGGTTLSLSSGPLYNSEIGWTGGPDGCWSNDGGSTGGFSAYWAAPSFQSAFGFGSRAVPDIALNADWYNSPQTLYYGGTLYSDCQTQFNCGGGTSIVAPEMAGFFAQENAYLLALGNVCGSGGSACSPMGNANYYLYDEGVYQTAPHYPFYDITSGCNDNDITSFYGLGYYCAGWGYDEVTGWGSANMLQLAWTINWFSTIYSGAPSVTFTGPAINTWYNSEQTVSWTVSDNSFTGIAGFTQGWDSIATDPYSEGTPGAGNSFYSGPQFPNATGGWLDFVDYSVSQGCHTAYVEAWDNMGEPTSVNYGPVCYDTTPPVTTSSLSGTLNGSVYVSSVTVTLAATDNASGVAATYYQLDGGAQTTYTAPFTVSATALGTHTVTYHSTDKAGNVETSHTVTFTIDATTSTSVTSSLNPSTYGTKVTFTATVTASSGTPTGTVTFKDGSTTLGTGTLSGGKATFAISTLAVGSHSITGVYGASGNFLGSTSSTLTQTVNIASSTTTVASSLNPATYGASVTFTATVTSSGGTPTGTVTFKNGSATMGTGTLSSGKATFTTKTLSAGNNRITAVYGGSTDFSGSTSSVLNQTVNPASTTTTLTSSLNPSKSGQSVTFTATVTSGGGTPAGTVTFKDGSSTLGTGKLNSSGKASFSTSTLAVGSHSITAVFGGNLQFATSTSAVLTQTVNQ